MKHVVRMSGRFNRGRMFAMLRHELRLFRRDPEPLVLFLAMPLFLIPFLRPVFDAQLSAHGHPETNGAEQAVPGMAVMFALFILGFVGYTVFRDHIWRTWDRLRASRAGRNEILLAKALPSAMLLLSQFGVLFGTGMLFFGLDAARIPALATVAVPAAICFVSLGLALTSACSSLSQLNAVSAAAAIMLAGLGGAVSPLDDMPGWIQAIAPATPAYWAMHGFTQVTIDQQGVTGVVGSAGMLLLFAAAFIGICIRRFHLEAQKVLM